MIITKVFIIFIYYIYIYLLRKYICNVSIRVIIYCNNYYLACFIIRRYLLVVIITFIVVSYYSDFGPSLLWYSYCCKRTLELNCQ